MKRTNVNGRSECPVGLTLDDIGDRWTLLIIRDLMFAGKQTYKELLESREGIATNILAARLRQLTENGIIQKIPHPQNARQNNYRLTQKGNDLLPILAGMIDWGIKYKPQANYPKDLINKIIRQKVG